MRTLKLEMQVSVDGFAADAEGSPKWMEWPWTDDWNWDEKLRQYHINLATSSDCLLLSRKMAEEGFHRHWEEIARNPADPQSSFAKPIAEMRKLVLTNTLSESTWDNTKLLTGNIVDNITRLKREKGKDILVYGGPTLASSLINAGLIDEFHLFINPTALGAGNPMFKDINHNLNLSLIDATPYDCGVVVLRYSRET